VPGELFLMCAFRMLSTADITRHLLQTNEWVWSKDGRIKTGENQSTQRKTCPNGILSITYSTWTGLKLNLGLCDEKPAFNCLNHGCVCVHQELSIRKVYVLQIKVCFHIS